MNTFSALRFRDVLPSAIGILVLGAVISLFYNPWSWFGHSGILALPLGVVIGAVIYTLMFFVSRSSSVMVDSIKELLRILHALFKDFTWTQIIIISLLAGIGEELLIRGALQTYLVQVSSPFLGMFLASFIFGLLHFLSKIYVFITFVIGFIFALLFHFTDSMLLVMIAHTVYDIFAFAMIVKFPHMLGLELNNEKITIIDQLDTQ